MINEETLSSFKKRFNDNRENVVIKNAVAKVGINDVSFNNEALRRHNFVFSEETKKGEITNQKNSGRCWMFAALNTARIDTMEKLNKDTFEFSENYTLFWDKLEKSNYFLDSILDTLDEAQDSRLIAHLLMAPVQDGGQWDMFAGILNKYGAVPKEAMPETFHSSKTAILNDILTSKLRQYAKDLRIAHKDGKTIGELQDMKEDMLYFIYNILVKALGEIPETFTYEYRDRDNQFHRIAESTPQDFFNNYVGWDLEDMVSLLNAPTKDKPYGRAYTVKYLGTVKEEKQITYINAPIEALKKAAIESIEAGEPVWFGCDVGKMSDRQLGIMDSKAFEYDLTLGEGIDLDKAERLDYGESLLTHAMVLIGVDLDNEGKSLNWKVENSWGDKVGKKGIFSMDDAWFDEYTYQIAVNKRYIDEKWMKALDKPIIELEPWDPMGALALVK
ncbi:C1 family peptidase [Jeotgalibaca sp. MA1X17-3]|uniref:aminopeptidase C n=1 Tax=Jeotgalibaca sp. MA1X17-3 TaxID=2908211 RepID=UPI001F271389|nr:C1 family peptidase [Jeotgalibaca sp. MA1X17-3]UJF16394.1 C1 family peptidase [Jeotgalibaca sp. MA1X17-3]